MIFYFQNKFFTFTKVFIYIINFLKSIIIAYKNKNLKEQKKFICPFKNCQKFYALKNILLAHLRTHYGIKPFVCSYCGKSFNEKGNLKTHIRIHTGERPFKCKKCNKGFKALGQLKDHLISHTGFKPFQCPYCQKFYRRKEILKNHVIIHAKEPFFQKNKEKFQEMLNNVKKMKNIIHDFDSSDSICKSNSIDSNSNCSISSNEDIKQSLNSSKITNSSSTNNSNLSLSEEKKIDINKTKNIFLPKKVKTEKQTHIIEKNEDKNKINLIEKFNTQNEFIINNKLFKDDYYLEWPNSLNDIMSSTVDFSLKDENSNIDNYLNNFENKDFSFQKMPNMAEKESNFSLNNNKNDFYLNKYNENNINNFENDKDNDIESEEDDCCSKITNLYYQEYDKKIFSEFLN